MNKWKEKAEANKDCDTLTETSHYAREAKKKQEKQDKNQGEG